MSSATLPTSEALAQYAYELRACAAAFSDSARAQLAGLQQTWTIDDLERRYHGMSRDHIIALLTEHCGYQGSPGKRPLIHVDQVLVIDSAVRKHLIA